jgi:hypothetical protein
MVKRAGSDLEGEAPWKEVVIAWWNIISMTNREWRSDANCLRFWAEESNLEIQRGRGMVGGFYPDR